MLARLELRRLERRCALALLGCAALAAAAQPPSEAPGAGVVVSSRLERLASVPGADGRIALEPTTGTVGSHAEELVMSVVFTNVSGEVLDNLRITTPVPPDVRYVPGTASGPGAAALFSVDQAASFGRPDELKVATADGGTRRADAADYTHVRFVLAAPLDVGTTGTVRFRVMPR